MAAKNQGQCFDALEQQVSEFMAGQIAMLQRQLQVDAWLESKLKSIGEMLRNQILTALKEQQAGISRKGKNFIKHPISHIMYGSTSWNEGGGESTGIGMKLKFCLQCLWTGCMNTKGIYLVECLN